MKKIGLLLMAVLLVSCETEVKKYVTLQGKVNNATLDKITLEGRGFSKDFTIREDGTFKDTVAVTDGVHAFVNGNDRITLFLKNGYDLDINFKGDNLQDGIEFSGVGAETNNFMENKRSFYMSDFADPKSYFKLNKEDFENKLSEAKLLLQSYKDKAPNLDSIIAKMDIRNDDMFFSYIELNYETMHENMVKLAKGKPSPVFENYENFKGGTNSLSDYKGKYVYLDIWATWCAPCKVEIPFLKQMDKDYHDKNIVFISISVDKPNAYDHWRKMVEEEALGGVQLYADNNFESEFILEYGINAIPRFILIDPKGNIVDADAPRPSDPNLKLLFAELGI